MSEMMSVTAADGHKCNAYLAEPSQTATAGIVLLPEIFGITQHLKDMADEYAKRGYRAIVPALFDRVDRDVTLAYDEIDKGLQLMNACGEAHALQDIQAAVNEVSVDEKVAVQGYCWGGSLAFISACELTISAAVSFYGGQIINQLHRKPRCRVLFHFGEQDNSIREENVIDIKATFVNFSDAYHIAHVYPNADHAFANHDRKSFDKSAASLANKRSYDFLSSVLG